MGFDTRREAERALRMVLHQVDEARFINQHDLTLEVFLEAEWIPVVGPPNLRESTWASYAGELRRHVIPSLGSAKIQDLRPAHLTRLYGELLRHGRKDGSGGLSPRTMRYIHTIVRKALSDAVVWELPERNPADRADPARRDTERQRRMMQIWSAEQLARFLDHARDGRLSAAWHLAATTGMRRGEVLGLRWSDLDFDSSALAVRQTYASVDGTSQFSEPRPPRAGEASSWTGQTLKVLRE